MTFLGKLFRTTAFKLSLAYLVVFAIGAGVVLGSVAWSVNSLLDAQIDQTVEAETIGLAEQYETGGIRQLVGTIERRTQQPGSSLYLLTNFAGQTIAGNVASLPPGVIDRPGPVETRYGRLNDNGRRHTALARVFLLPSGFRLLVGRDLDERETLRAVMLHALVQSLVWLVLIGLLGGLFFARRVLRRVDAINATVQRIMAGDLAGRLPDAGTGDELDRLARNLNAMLERIGELMAGLREVSDNIAHDLRTPLTRLRNRAEEALRTGGEPEHYRDAIERIIEEADGLIAVFNALLMIARAEAGTGREGMVTCDAGEMMRDVAELYEPAAEESGVTLELSLAPDLPVLANRELFGQALANLIDNALKYGASGGTVSLSARRHDGWVECVVADHGPGIPPEDRGRVLDRFVRLEGSRSRPGSGLGLSLVAAIALLHGGTLRLESHEPGLRAVLALRSARRSPEAIEARVAPQSGPALLPAGPGTR